MKKINKLFLSACILAAFTILCSCMSSDAKKIEKNMKKKQGTEQAAVVEIPSEVENLTMPDGWSDETLNKIADEEEITKPIMAIMDFKSNADVELNVKDLGLNDMLTTAMFKTNKFDLVEREKLNLVLKEQKLNNSDDFDPSTAAEIGALLGAQYIITGKITSAVRNVTDEYQFYKLKADLTINISVIEVSTGKIFKAVEGIGSDATKLYTDDRGNVVKGPAGLVNATIEQDGKTFTIKGPDMTAQFVGAAKAAIADTCGKLEATFPLIGYCIHGTNETFMTDVGTKRGIKKGDYFIVIRTGNEIRHPKTKKVISVEKTVVASGVVEGVGDEESTARIYKLKTEGDIPVSGDVVISISSKRGNDID